MRVLFVIHHPVFGGPHNQALRLRVPLARRGWDTHVLLPTEDGNAAERLAGAGVVVHRTQLGRIRATISFGPHARLIRGLASDVNRIRQVVRQNAIDVVVTCGLVNPHASVAARAENVGLIWQIVDTRTPRAIALPMSRVAASVSDVVMTTGTLVAYRHGLRPNGSNIISFFPPVDLELFRASPDAKERARAILGASVEVPLIGTVGNLNPQKGHKDFVRAAALLRRHHPDAGFVILGASYPQHAQYLRDVLDLARSCGLAENDALIIRDPADKVDLLAQALDVFWLTSEKASEGVPTAVEEAMALGVPVVAYDVGSTAEIVSNDSGRLVSHGDVRGLVDSTRSILEQPDLSRALSQAARLHASTSFGVDTCADIHVAAFEQALSRRAASRPRSTRAAVTAPTTVDIWSLLRCPVCHGELNWLDQLGQCAQCTREFSIIDGIPIMLTDPSASAHDDALVHVGERDKLRALDIEEFETERPHGTPALYQWLLRRKFDLSVDALGSLQPEVALTVCGGSGMDAEYLAAAGWRVVCSDISLAAARRAQTRARRRGVDITSVVADAHNLPFATGSISLVYVHDGLHHLEAPDAALREMTRVARNALSVTEPAQARLTGLAVRLGLAREREEAGNVVRRLSVSQVTQRLAEGGFPVARKRRYLMYYPHRPGILMTALSRQPLVSVARFGAALFMRVGARVGNKLSVQALARQQARDQRFG